MPAFPNLNWVGVRIAFSKLYRWVCFVSHWRPVAFHGALRYAGQSKCRFFRHLLKETAEKRAHVTRELFRADIGGGTKEHPLMRL
jgi:hypothetical protein